MEYKKQLVKFNLNKIANLSLLLFLLPFAAALFLNLLAFKRPLLITGKVYFDIIMIIGIYIVGLVCHEGLHALGAVIFGKCSPKDIKFGVIPKQMMLYCHVKTPLTVASYRYLLLLPVIVTGIIPLIISTILGNIFLVAVFAMLVSGGAGDFIMVHSLSKYPSKQLICDHPEAPAYYLVYPSDNLPDDFDEATEEQEDALREEMKRAPGQTADGKSKNNLLKILGILVFLAFAALIVFLIALMMKMF